MNHHTVKHRLFIFAVITFVFLLLTLGYYNFIDGRLIGKPITFSTDPMAIKTDKEVYKRGETVYGFMEYCKNREVDTVVQWSMVDGFLTIFPKKNSYVGKGCKSVKFEIEKIPISTTPEPSIHFEGVIQYQVNVFSVISVPLKTNSFEIIK